jgi:predicted hotdog family 3-hydroxylacyl-ACP dehydratase
MTLDHLDIARLIPHAGRMVLLDRVVDYDTERLQATAVSHRQPENPLRRAGRLSPLAGAEYAAQAMAVHGALLAGEGASPRPGFLAALRDIRWTVDRLDTIADDLEIRIHLVTAQSASVMYDFRLTAGTRLLLTGRAAVFFNAASPAP